MSEMKSKDKTKKIIGELLQEIVEGARNGTYKKTVIGLMAYGSELGNEELLKGAIIAMQNSPQIEVLPIGPKIKGYERFDWIETEADEQKISDAMEDALNSGKIKGAVALHYPFPLGVTTIGKVVTPAKGKNCYIASSTGTSATNRLEAMIKNAIYGIAAAKSNGISTPSVGILNLDGGRTVFRALQSLNDNGYEINFASSSRKEAGAVLRGNDLLAGTADVCVTDTLTGNVLMKLFSAWNSGGSYESVGYGYGPSVGEGWEKVISIVSRVSGAPVIANAILYTAQSTGNNLSQQIQKELSLARAAGLDEIINSLIAKSSDGSVKEIEMPKKETTDEEIQGIDVLEIESAVKTLWESGIYAESSMGCTGPVIKLNSTSLNEAEKILKEGGFI